MNVIRITDLTDFLGVTNSAKNKPVEAEKANLNRENLGPREVYLVWEYIPRVSMFSLDPRFKKTLLATSLLIMSLLIVMQEFWILLFIVSTIFLGYVLSTRFSQEKITYELNTHGMLVGGNLYYWDELERFFFPESMGNDLVAVDQKKGLPSRFFLGYHIKDRERIKTYMNKHLVFLEKEPLTFVDKVFNKVIGKFDFQQKK